MNGTRSRSARWHRRLIHPPRAVIDIGSNTVRLVIYEGTARAPEVVWNENVAARLGRDLSKTGRIPTEAEAEALAALARYAQIVADRGIVDVQTVATAATRDAENGPEFLARVAELGLAPRQLTGVEEANASAFGAIGAFPSAAGVVADLGGGSLELVSIAEGTCHHAASLPFGTLRLPALRAAKGKFAKRVHEALERIGWASAHSGPLFMIGGTWRAFAHYAMREADYPLTDPHGFRLSSHEADQLAKVLAETKPANLQNIPGITPMRAAYLPDAAALLRPLLAELEPTELIFSSWGIREGMLFSQLSSLVRAQDPLLAGVQAFAEPRDASITDAASVAGWTADIARGTGKRNERLRLASALLAAALQRVEPNLRINHAAEWALDKRWIDCSPRDRAMVCAALYGSLGRTGLDARLRVLASDDELREAVTWGLGFRLARRLGAGALAVLGSSRLRLKKNSLLLHIDKSHAALATPQVAKELEILAEWLGRKPQLQTGPREVAELAV